MRSARAIACRISALGFRNPRSIWLRYGFEMPASSLSLRSDSRALRRWSRMNSPRSCSLDSRSVIGARQPPASSPASDLPHRVPCRQRGVHAVDDLVHGVALLRHLLLQLAELLDRRPELLLADAREVGERRVGDEVLEPALPLDAHGRRQVAR